MNDAGLIAAAKLVRPYLPELVGPEQTEDWDNRLGTMLASDAGEQQLAAEILAVLRSDEVVLQWVEDVLDDPRRLPPELQRLSVRGAEYAPVPGGGEVIDADRFVCPVNGDVVWYRPRVGVPIKRCLFHNRELVRG